jgi:threonine aldolase
MIIDLRSDTVTRPTPAMLDAMFSAPVGDDVFGEDPTIIALEQKGADLFGMESSVFCPSGTMTNQIAMRIHMRPGDEVICHRYSHIYNYEGGGVAANTGASMRLLEGNGGKFTAEDIRMNINPDDVHFPITRLVSGENTVNKGGGVCWDMSEMQSIAATCKENNLIYHLDGARMMNAIVAKQENATDYGKIFDTISLCLSKGLGAPVGSLLMGSAAEIKQARRVRKMFGGGMRQAGYLAAAAIYALDNNVDRLEEDHKRARQLGEILDGLPFVKKLLPIETNIIVFELTDAVEQQAFLQQLLEKGVKAVAFGHQTIRFVTHLDFDDDQLNALETILKAI